MKSVGEQGVASVAKPAGCIFCHVTGRASAKRLLGLPFLAPPLPHPHPHIQPGTPPRQLLAGRCPLCRSLRRSLPSVNASTRDSSARKEGCQAG
eukprot:2670454-Pleurochrysis_carterae.AAC.1